MNYPLIRPHYYLSLLKEVVRFLKAPDYRRNLEKNTKQKVYDTFGLYVLKLILLIPLIVFFALIYDPKDVQSVSLSERFSPLALILVAGFILPLAEEVAFRLSLRFKPSYLAISAAVLVYYLLTKFVFQTKISAVDESFLARVAISGLLGLLLFPVVSRPAIGSMLERFWVRHFRAIFYVICVVFAWVHITKYETTLINIMLLPILTLPQLMSAIMYGYTRVAFGFQYPVISHTLNNLLAVSISFLPATDLLF